MRTPSFLRNAALAAAATLLAPATEAQVNNSRIWDHVVSLGYTYTGQQLMFTFNGAQTPVPSVLPPLLHHILLAVSHPATGDLLFAVGTDTLVDRYWHAIPCTPAWNDPVQLFRNVIPHPGNPDLYYLITQDSDTSSSFRWSLLDMTLNNGLGGLTAQRNVPWISGVMANYYGLLSGTDGDIYWFVTHEKGNNTWRFDPVLPDLGIGTPPVLVQAGPVLGLTPWGHMRIAPDNQHLEYPYQDGFDWKLDICSIDPYSLAIGPALTLPGHASQPYRHSISPDGTKLYQFDGVLDTSLLNQYDLAAGTAADVLNSASTILTLPASGIWMTEYMHLMPDGKLYLRGVCFNGPDTCFAHDHLPFIAAPNVLGAGCGLTLPGVYTDGNLNGPVDLPELWWPVRWTGEGLMEAADGAARAVLRIEAVDGAAVGVVLEGARMRDARLQVCDALGRTVADVPWPAGAQRTVVPTSSMAGGPYVFVLRGGDGTLATAKWMKE